MSKAAEANFETIKHIQEVQEEMHKIIVLLLERSRVHDRSKLEEPEVSHFVEHTNKLKDLTYGTEEYSKNLETIAPALEHHYANNRHHPQHFKGGINDMHLVDIIEMFCDWRASTKRTKSGNLRKSLEINAERFKIGKQLAKILDNTIEILDN